MDISEDRRTIQTDVRDLRKFQYPERGLRDWRHAEVRSQTLFIVETYEGPPGHQVLCIYVAGNVFDALASYRAIGEAGGGMYLFTKHPGTNAQAIMFGKVAEVVGAFEDDDVVVTLVDGTTLVLDTPRPRTDTGRVRSARLLYSVTNPTAYNYQPSKA